MAHHSPARVKANTASDTELNLEYAASIILRVFKKHDVDDGGTLQRRELRSLLRQCGATLTARQCDEIIDQLDTDGDGEMNFAEFMSFLGRLYQLQFFGTDPGEFWKKAGQQGNSATHNGKPPGRGTPPPLPQNRHSGPVPAKASSRPLPPPPSMKPAAPAYSSQANRYYH